MGVKIGNFHGQCYDIVSNTMFAEILGVAMRLSAIESCALHTHCYVHA